MTLVPLVQADPGGQAALSRPFSEAGGPFIGTWRASEGVTVNNCVAIQSPPEGNYYTLPWDTKCGSDPPSGGANWGYSFVAIVTPGEYYGANIPLTDESEVHCKVWFDNDPPQTDDAYANQGSGSANYIRQVNSVMTNASDRHGRRTTSPADQNLITDNSSEISTAGTAWNIQDHHRCLESQAAQRWSVTIKLVGAGKTSAVDTGWGSGLPVRSANPHQPFTIGHDTRDAKILI
jgi:hypothetical protein